MIAPLLTTDSSHMPAPRWPVAAWLLAPVRSIGPEGDAELRQSLLRRLDAILLSAAITLGVAIIAFVQHPTPWFGSWMALELLLAAVRIPIAVRMVWFSRSTNPKRALPPWIADAFVGAGTAWSALLGFGTMLCVSTSDPGLSIIAALVVTATVGAQGSRNPGSPRLNCVQMCLITVPFAAGTLLSTIPLIRWTLVLTPIYLIGLISITRQLHEDYVALLLAQMKNGKRALHCPLTGLPNRAHFDESLEATLARASAENRSITMMYVDLDGFKSVNDNLGHAAGDTLLVEVSDRLRVWAGSRTLVARIGGDEFAIILATEDVHEAEREARDLIDTLRRPYDLGLGRIARIGVTIGLSSSEPGMKPSILMAQADSAMYAAKRSGKGTFRWFDVNASEAEAQGHAAAA